MANGDSNDMDFDGFDGAREDTFPPMMRAVFSDSERLLRESLDKGHSPRTPDNRGMTALHAAAQLGREDMMRLMLAKCPGSINTVSTHVSFFTPLYFALNEGHFDLARYLVREHGADYDPNSEICHPVLHGAANMDVEILKIADEFPQFKDWGVSNRYGEGAFLLLLQGLETVKSTRKQRSDFFQLLVDKGANPFFKNDSATSIHVIMSHPDVDCCLEGCELLLDSLERWRQSRHYNPEDEAMLTFVTSGGELPPSSAIMAVLGRMNVLDPDRESHVKAFCNILERMIQMGAEVNTPSFGTVVRRHRIPFYFHADRLPIELCMHGEAVKVIGKYTNFYKIKMRLGTDEPGKCRMNNLPNPPLGVASIYRTPFHCYTCMLDQCFNSLLQLLKTVRPDDFINRRWKEHFYTVSNALLLTQEDEAQIERRETYPFTPDLIDELGGRVMSASVEPWACLCVEKGTLPFKGMTPLAELLFNLRRQIVNNQEIPLKAVRAMVVAGSSPNSIMIFDNGSNFEGYTVDPLVCLCGVNLPGTSFGSVEKKVVQNIAKYLADEGGLVSLESAAILILTCEDWLFDEFLKNGVLPIEDPEFGKIMASRKLQNSLIHPKNVMQFHEFLLRVLVNFGNFVWGIELTSLIPSSVNLSFRPGTELYENYEHDIEQIELLKSEITEESKKVSSLLQLSRTVIRTSVYREGENTARRIDKLFIPESLKMYLNFK